METQSWILKSFGTATDAFVLKSVQLPKLKANEVMIEVEAFGLNYADVMARKGLYRETPPLPCTIGYEVVGKVIDVCGETARPLLGKRVVAFTRFGGYSKHVITTLHACVEVGDAPAEEVMALATQGVTAYYMTHVVAPIQSGDRVLVHAAAGGVGTLLIQMAKLRGAEVYAKVSSEQKGIVAQELGADHVVNYRSAPYGETMTKLLGNNRLDVSYNPVAGTTVKVDKGLLGAGGRLFLFGGSELANGSGGFFAKLRFVWRMGFYTPIAFMVRSQSLVGVNMLKIGDAKPHILEASLQGAVDLYLNKQVRVVSGGVYAANELHKAHELLESGKSVGKLIVRW